MEASFFSAILLPTSLGLLMFGMGLSLSLKDFERVLIKPRSLIIGLCCQMLLLPLIAFSIATLANLSEEIKVGIVIIAACPGGATSNLITYLLRGNVALSISMTAINSLLTLVSIPFIIFLSLKWFTGSGTIIQLPVWNTIINIFLVTLLPTSVGVFTKYKFPIVARKLEKPGRFILPSLYAIIFLIAMFGAKGESTQEITSIYLRVAPFVLLLNILGMISGYSSARMLKYGKRTQITLSVEVGIQNSALAITIAGSSLFLNNPNMAIPAIVYGFFTFFSAVIFGIIINKNFKLKLK